MGNDLLLMSIQVTNIINGGYDFVINIIPNLVISILYYGSQYNTNNNYNDNNNNNMISSSGGRGGFDHWPHTWMDDTYRVPLLVLKVVVNNPTSSLSSITSTTTDPTYYYYYALYGFSIVYWIEMVLLVILECILFAAPTAIIIYYFILQKQNNVSYQQQQQQNNNNNNNKQMSQHPSTTIVGYIIGWCILLPLWIIVPSQLSTMLGIDNYVIRFCLCVITPTLSLFRIIEVMYGFTPSHAIVSIYTYMLYFACPLFLYPKNNNQSMIHSNNNNNNTKLDPSIKSTFVGTTNHHQDYLTAAWNHGIVFAKGLCLTGIYKSILYEIYPYGSGPISTPSNLYMWSSLYDVHLWYETILYAILFQLYLSTFSAGLAMTTTIVTGCITKPFSDRPLQCCTSPSDFWGRRWNLLIHQSLKNGIYKPVRSVGGPISLAVFATFIASGLFHEWLLPSVIPNYPHTHGTALAFFLWQAMLIAIEILIGKHISYWLSSIIQYIPRPMITICVIALGLPVGHWFVDSYLRSDFFIHGHFCFPMIYKVVPTPSNDTIPKLLFQLGPIKSS